VLLAAFGWWAAGPLFAAILAALGFFLPTGLVRAVRRRRRGRFDAQLTGALQQLSNCLRAGLTLQQGIDQVGRESRPPLQQEFGLFGKEVKLGVAPEEALAAIAHRVGSEDMELVATSANIARQMGGNMAEMLETIAATIRERFRLEGRIDALTSQGKLQGAIVSALPPCIGLGFAWLRPDLVAPMFEGPFGYGVVAAVALLEAIGFLLIRRIVGIDV
jgi:tight adherence protein B